MASSVAYLGSVMTVAAYLTEKELAQELRIPHHLAGVQIEMWKLHPSFPKPVKWLSGRANRYWFPEVVQWLNRLHHVEQVGRTDDKPIPITIGPKGKFDEWRQTRKARKSRRPGADLPPPPVGMGAVVVTTIGPDSARVQGEGDKTMAEDREPA